MNLHFPYSVVTNNSRSTGRHEVPRSFIKGAGSKQKLEIWKRSTFFACLNKLFSEILLYKTHIYGLAIFLIYVPLLIVAIHENSMHENFCTKIISTQVTISRYNLKSNLFLIPQCHRQMQSDKCMQNCAIFVCTHQASRPNIFVHQTSYMLSKM